MKSLELKISISTMTNSYNSTVCITPNNEDLDKKRSRHLILNLVSLTIWTYMKCCKNVLCTSFDVSKDHIGCLSIIEHYRLYFVKNPMNICNCVTQIVNGANYIS